MPLPVKDEPDADKERWNQRHYADAAEPSHGFFGKVQDEPQGEQVEKNLPDARKTILAVSPRPWVMPNDKFSDPGSIKEGKSRNKAVHVRIQPHFFKD